MHYRRYAQRQKDRHCVCRPGQVYRLYDLLGGGAPIGFVFSPGNIAYKCDLCGGEEPASVQGLPQSSLGLGRSGEVAAK